MQDKYIFYPKKNLIKTSLSSSSIQNIKNVPKIRSSLNINENIFYIKKKFPPIYFYRKIENPYKYNLSSIPDYLRKANEEKFFLEKIQKNLTNEEKVSFDELIYKNNKNKVNNKDRYKPEMIEVNNILKYRPKYYMNSFKNLYIPKVDKKIDENDIKINLIKNEINNNANNKEKIFSRKNINFSRKLSRNNSLENLNNFKMNSFSSVGYNILSPSYKGLNKFISPTEINKNNLYNESPIFHRTKSLGDYGTFSIK